MKNILFCLPLVVCSGCIISSPPPSSYVDPYPVTVRSTVIDDSAPLLPSTFSAIPERPRRVTVPAPVIATPQVVTTPQIVATPQVIREPAAAVLSDIPAPAPQAVPPATPSTVVVETDNSITATNDSARVAVTATNSVSSEINVESNPAGAAQLATTNFNAGATFNSTNINEAAGAEIPNPVGTGDSATGTNAPSAAPVAPQ